MKRIYSIIISLVLIFSLCTVPVSGANTGYPDTEGHWAEEAIKTWSDKGILRGYEGLFRPDKQVTRGELATILYKVMGYQPSHMSGYPDLNGAWSADAINSLTTAKVMKGDGGMAYPEKPVSRQEAAVLFARAFHVTEGKPAEPFLDRNEIEGWATDAVDAMAAAGYLQGYKGRYNPTMPMTRASVVTVLNNLCTAFYDRSGIYSDDVVGSVVVRSDGVTLKDMEIKGDLIIAAGVGDGTVDLDSVTVTGRTIVQGGGEHSIKIYGSSNLSMVIITKTADNKVRLVGADGVVIPHISVDDGKDGVLLEGLTGTKIIVEGSVDLEIGKGMTDVDISVNKENSTVTVKDGASVANLDVAATATVSVDKGASIDVLNAAAKNVTVNNNGTVSDVDVRANGLVLNGTKPNSVNTANGVQAPSGSGSPNNPPSGGGGGGGGGSSTPSAPQTLNDVTVQLGSPQALKQAVAPVAARAGYTVSAVWSPALIGNCFDVNTAYTVTLTVEPIAGYRWGNGTPSITLTNNTQYGDNGVVGNAVLANDILTFTAIYPATLNPTITVEQQPEDMESVQGQTGTSLHASALVKAGGVSQPNYPLSRQWYACDDENKNNERAIQGAISGDFALPTDLQADQTYYYFCRFTAADGKLTADSKVATVTIKASGGTVVLQNLKLEAPMGMGGIVNLSWSYADSNKTDYFSIEAYSESVLVYEGTNSGIDEPSINIGASLVMKALVENSWTDSFTIDKLKLTPIDSQGQPVGDSATLDCTIKVNLTELTGFEPKYDSTTKILSATGLPTTTSYQWFALSYTGGNVTEQAVIGQHTSSKDHVSTGVTDGFNETGATARLALFNVRMSNGETNLQICRSDATEVSVAGSGS